MSPASLSHAGPGVPRRTTEFNQTRLLRMQLQPELRDPFPQVRRKWLRFALMLKPQNGVVGVAHDHDITIRPFFPPLLCPEIEHIMQVQICQQRGNDSPNAKDNLGSALIG